MAEPVDWDRIISHQAYRKSSHRNAAIALAFLAGLAIVGYYTAPPDQGSIPLARPSGSAGEPVNAADSPCGESNSEPSGMSCQEAVAVLLARYPGEVVSVSPASSEELGMGQAGQGFWKIDLTLEAPVAYGEVSLPDRAEFAVNRNTGRITLYRYTS